MAFLGVRFEVGAGGKITPCLKLVRIMLETETWYASTHTCVVLEIYPFVTSLLILLMSAFFCKRSAFFGQHSTFTYSNSVTAVLEIF